MAKGDAWKHKQYRPHGLSGIPRNYTRRELKSESQFWLNNVYLLPILFYTTFQVLMADELPRYTDLEWATCPDVSASALPIISI